MTLDEAIQHCKEQVQEQAKRGCYRCAEEHQQLAEWLKELKEYREQRDGRMNEAEKERLIKKDIASIENRVRHAFNQGYEMGVKVSRSEIPNICGDAISRQAVLEIQAEYAEYMKSTKFWEMRDDIKALPSVSPQQRTGRWIDNMDLGYHVSICSNCNWRGHGDTCLIYKPKFCPNCGAKMVEPQESEEV